MKRGVDGVSKVGIIGVGHVGATVAHVVVQKGLATELVLIDKKVDKAKSEKLDLQDASSFLSTHTSILVGDYKDVADADVIVSALGHIHLLKQGGDRFAELKKNEPEVKAVAKELKRVGFSGKLLVVTNPNDVMTELYARELDLPHRHVIGSGTVLDSSRMKHYVGDVLGVDSRSVSGYVLGEHGDSQFVAWSSVAIGGRSIVDFVKEANLDLDDLENQARQGGFYVHLGKGYTNVAIAESTVHILEALLKDAKRVLSVSHYHLDKDSYVSTPAIVGKNGIEGVIDLSLNQREQDLLDLSVKMIKEKHKQFGS